MRVLILTQKIDANDDLLGFFHGWVFEFSKHWEKITVIALGVGDCHLAENVKVLSLGKEAGGSKLIYLVRFYKYIWRERKNYDSVFVHMNQEYTILGGLIWRLLGKKVMLWRNHQMGGFWAKIAVALSHIVFCTSQFAFVARYKKTKLMPVGIDADFFKFHPEIKKTPGSVLFFGRISPIKRPDILIESLYLLKKGGINFIASFVGDAPLRDAVYNEKIKQKIENYDLADCVKIVKGVPYLQAPKIYNQNEIFINLTNSGSLDKTILEAMACESMVLVSNKTFEGVLPPDLIFQENSAADLAKKIGLILNLSEIEIQKRGRSFRDYVLENHSLDKLIFRLAGYLQN